MYSTKEENQEYLSNLRYIANNQEFNIRNDCDYIDVSVDLYLGYGLKFKYEETFFRKLNKILDNIRKKYLIDFSNAEYHQENNDLSYCILNLADREGDYNIELFNLSKEEIKNKCSKEIAEFESFIGKIQYEVYDLIEQYQKGVL